jgi:hypothetical protein
MISSQRAIRIKKLIILLLLIIGTAFSAKFAFTSPTFTYSEIVWKPRISSDSGSLLLSRSKAEELNLESRCSSVSMHEGVFFDAGGITLSKNKNFIVLESNNKSFENIVLEYPSGECKIMLSASLSNELISLVINDSKEFRQVKSVDFPIITKLVIPEGTAPTVDFVLIETRPTGIVIDISRYIFLLLAFISLVVCFSLYFGHRIILRSIDHYFFKALRLDFLSFFRIREPIDFVILFSLVFLSFTTPTFLDDGWVLARIKNYENTNVFSNIFQNSDVWLPQVHFWEYVLHSLNRLGLSFIYLRLFLALLLFLTWLLLKKMVFRGIPSQSRIYYLPAAVFLIFSSSWLITLRAEPAIVFLNTILIINLVSFIRTNQIFHYAITLLIGMLMIQTHQTGVVALGPILISSIIFLREIKRYRKIDLFFVFFMFLNLTVIIFSLFLDIGSVLEGLSEFSNSSHNLSYINEPLRYIYLFRDSSGLRIFTVLILFLNLVFSFLFFKLYSRLEKLLFLTSLTQFLGLILTSSKWPWHFGAYTVSVVVIMFLVSKYMLTNPRKLLVILYLMFLTFSLGFSLNSIGTWGHFDLVGLNWTVFSDLFGLDNNYKTYILLSMLFVFVILIFNLKSFNTKPLYAFFFSLYVIPLILTQFWLISDNFKTKNWTPLKQNIYQFQGLRYCGAVDPVMNEQLMSVRDDYSLFAGPFEFVLFPCINFPYPRTGVWPRIDFAVEGATLLPELYDLRTSKFGCSLYSNICFSRLSYPIAKVSILEKNS